MDKKLHPPSTKNDPSNSMGETPKHEMHNSKILTVLVLSSRLRCVLMGWQVGSILRTCNENTHFIASSLPNDPKWVWNVPFSSPEDGPQGGYIHWLTCLPHPGVGIPWCAPVGNVRIRSAHDFDGCEGCQQWTRSRDCTVEKEADTQGFQHT